MDRILHAKHIVFPFVYFFLLSIGMVVLVSTLAAGGLNRFAVSYAQDDLIDIDEIRSEIASEGETTLIDPLAGVFEEAARDIDAYFETQNAPLAGYGTLFAQHARKNDIDPYLVAAIGFCESTGGKTTPQFNNQESYNAWGYAVFDNNETTKNMGAYGMGSFENGIAIMSRVMKKYAERGLKTPAEIVTRYTPASVAKANGVPALAPWTLCVNGTIEKMKNSAKDNVDE